MTIRVATLTGPAILPLLPALARLRIAVFREWPYLYDGDATYESGHLRSYADSPDAAIVVAFDDETPVGASTCLPLPDASADVQAPFRERGFDPERFFYFGESVLLPAYRGQGIGVEFFSAREAHARRAACDFSCFCAVLRPQTHPARPADAVPLDAFWDRRGYMPRPDLACRMAWKDVSEPAQTTKTLRFWLKSLSGVPLP